MPIDPKTCTPTAPCRHVVVAPTFNHGASLGAVLASLGACSLPIIVVNDGATDNTPHILERWLAEHASSGTRFAITHESNQGKAAALRTGFAEAARRGFTHAITIDTDGQHDPADLPALLDLSQKHPLALIIGARANSSSSCLPKSQIPSPKSHPPPNPKSHLRNAPLASRIGRTTSNHLVWLESGVRTTDSQSGLRVYPLYLIEHVPRIAPRYAFETEILTRAGWLGVPVLETPIRCIYDVPGGRTSHFRLVRDSLAAARMHLRLIARAHLPGPVRLHPAADHSTGSIPRRLARWFSPRRLWRMARGDPAARERVAASFGVGMLMATLPLYGIKTAACLWLSKRFRLHPLVVISTSSLSTPPLGFVFILLSVTVGHIILRGELLSVMTDTASRATALATMKTMLLDWAIGSIIAGTFLGVLTYWLARIALRPREP